MSLTGIFLVLFLIEHVFGNFFLFVDSTGVAYDEYSHNMTHNIFIQIVEIILFLSFIFHIIDGTMLWMKNRASRPVGYAVSRRSQNSFWTSRNMIISGSIIFLFLIIHLKTFFFPYRFDINSIQKYNGQPSIYHEVKYVFQHSIAYASFYVFAMILLCLHLHHGFSSAFQTIGMRHPKYYPFLKAFGLVLSIVICAGFAAQPIYFLLINK
jgi:succinate dehydrogenase / fumarate reductase cytochrome b subunit